MQPAWHDATFVERESGKFPRCRATVHIRTGNCRRTMTHPNLVDDEVALPNERKRFGGSARAINRLTLVRAFTPPFHSNRAVALAGNDFHTPRNWFCNF